MAVKVCLDCKHVFTIQPFKSSSIYKFHCGCVKTFTFTGEDERNGKDQSDLRQRDGIRRSATK